jgi:hypothetical protein
MAAPTFIEWLHAQALADSGKRMPYSALYEIGAEVELLVGDHFDMLAICENLREFHEDPEDIERYTQALALAEATYRVDLLCYEGKSMELEKVDDDGDETVICGYRPTSGSGCTNVAVEGFGRCEEHGGGITDPDVRRSLLLVSYAKILEGSSTAVEALINIVEHSRSDMARVGAAKELLDRAGLVQDQHVQIHTSPTDSDEYDPMADLRSRLNEARERLQLTSIPVRSSDADEDVDDGSHRAAS